MNSKIKENTVIPKRPVRIRRSIKDFVFRDLFSDTENVRKLYLAIHPEDDDITADEIKIVTLNTVATDTGYNDLGFMVRDCLLILVEDQSDWSENILIRSILYVAQTYDELIKQSGNIYSSRKLVLPVPELYVIYTGERRKIPEIISLKDDFLKYPGAMIDARIKVLSKGRPGDIISQFIFFAKTITAQTKENGYSETALKNTIDICISQGVLCDYLEQRRLELMGIWETLYDQETVTANWLREEKRESEREGIEKTLALLDIPESQKEEYRRRLLKEQNDQ